MKEFSVQLADRTLAAREGDNLYGLLRREGLAPDAYCGGQGRCGKCLVRVNGREVLACRTSVAEDMKVELPAETTLPDAAAVFACADARPEGVCLAFDIGTTTLVGFLLDEEGQVLSARSELNPQLPYGADVVSRLRSAVTEDSAGEQGRLIREGVLRLARELGALPGRISRICAVGNPAMQQLFFGISCDNLIGIPFTPHFRRTECLDAGAYLPDFAGAALYTLPDFAGYVGADICADLIAEDIGAAPVAYTSAAQLLVDIGTNGEMVLSCASGLYCTATAAGPALEGAGISCGMRAARGAIDRVQISDGRMVCHLIGEEKDPDLRAAGICGCGLIDAVACALDLGLLDRRGRLLNGPIPLRDGLSLSQDDVRALMMAKGAIAAGITLLTDEAGIGLEDIGCVKLAGAFGSFLDPASACRIGLLPKELSNRIRSVGNAAGRGACLFAADPERRSAACDCLAASVRAVELSRLPGFSRRFAKCMMLEP